MNAKQCIHEAEEITKEIEARASMPAGVKGSDLSVLIRKIQAWIEGLSVGGLGSDGLRMVLSYVIDELIPKLMAATPTSVDLIITLVVTPLLKKWRDSLGAV